MESILADYLRDVIAVFRKHKDWADGAMAQIDDAAYFRDLGERNHSVAVVVKHTAGNLRSRWRDFLTTDGEKPDRNRDGEFVLTPADTRPALTAAWEEGFAILFASLAALRPDDVG